jgi:hypothetical protein
VGDISGPITTGASRARAAQVAAWVNRDAAVGLQRAVDAGPNRWGALPNKPQGARFQRGLSGDYSSGTGGLAEAKNLLSGRPDSNMRTVSQIHDGMPPGKTTHEVTAKYSDPMSVRGRSDRIDPSLGRDPDREALLPQMSIADVEAIGFFPNSSDPLGWSKNYLELLEQTKAVPTPGSRGDKFVQEVRTILDKAVFGENDFGRYYENASELNAELRQLFVRYGTRVE